MTFSLCVVGCGQFAKKFAKGVRAFIERGGLEHIDLYFASRDSAKARRYCRTFDGTGFFGSYEEAAADPAVQSLYFVTPHHLHIENALMAARHGKHILMEKPLARTVEEGERMIVTARQEGVKLMVAENYRFLPMVERSRQLIEGGALGNLRLIQIQAEGSFPADGWRGNREVMGGGVAIDGAVHAADILYTLGGTPTEVYAYKLPQAVLHLEGEDGLVIMARMPNGGVGLINHSWGVSKSSNPMWVNVSGTAGRIYFEAEKTTMTLETDEGSSRFRFPEDRSGVGNMVKEFVSSIEEDRPPLMSGEVGLRDLKVVLKAYESAETRTVQALG